MVVSKCWQFCEARSLKPRKHGGGNHSNLSYGDLQFIEALKMHRPSILYSEIEGKLFDFGDLPGGDTSKSALSNTVRRRMPSGENFTFKKMTCTRCPRATYCSKHGVHANVYRLFTLKESLHFEVLRRIWSKVTNQWIKIVCHWARSCR